MKRALILCTGNSCRSQMAEWLWRRIANEVAKEPWDADSAGSRPAGYVHPLAIRAMSELGEDLSSAESKSLDQYRKEAFDLVVTVCGNAQADCPAFPGAARIVHWPFEDPADATGSEAEKMSVFRRVRDEIAARIRTFFVEGSSAQCTSRPRD